METHTQFWVRFFMLGLILLVLVQIMREQHNHYAREDAIRCEDAVRTLGANIDCSWTKW